jgi:hypothetical protein
MFAGWITFSAFEHESATHAQAQVLMRAQDPITELGLTLGGHRKEDAFWAATLRALARRFDIQAEPETNVICVERRRQWSRVGNVRYNAAFKSSLHTATTPFRKLSRPAR